MIESRPKVRELSIFTIGIGVLLAALTLWLAYALPESGRVQRTSLAIVIPLCISAVYVVLGIVVRKWPSSTTVIVAMVVVALGFAIDLVTFFNPVKAGIDALVIALVIKTGREALDEV